MNDERLEDRLREGLRHGAARLTVEPPEAIGAIAGAADAARARRRRQRRVVTSLATVAAVGAGLVVISRDPGQPVRTQRERNGAAAAAGGLAAGAATGSTTGSATGAPRGWDMAWDDTTAADDRAPLFAMAPRDGYELLDRATSSSERGSGQAAADLAVVADVRVGAPLRFVVASVQDADRLTSGRGGTKLTLAGRPARIISHRSATVLTYDLSDAKRALVYVAGVDQSVVERLLGSLVERDGGWVFDANVGGGLEPVAVSTPAAQYSRSQTWQQTAATRIDPCSSGGYGLTVTTGGTYEYWARVADWTMWDAAAPAVVSVRLPNGFTTPALESVDGSRLLALDGDAVMELSQWTADGSAPVPISAGLAGSVVLTTAEQWAAAAPAPRIDPSTCRETVPAEEAAAKKAAAEGAGTEGAGTEGAGTEGAGTEGAAPGAPAPATAVPSTSIGAPGSEPAPGATTSPAGANG